MDFRLLEYRLSDPYYNMACDEAILESFIAGESPPTIRFYGWNCAAVSLGYLQPAVGSLTPQNCRKCGVTLVRRPTGGRAVAHGHDFTFSIVSGADRTVGASSFYRKTGAAVVQALAELGITAEMCSSRSSPQNMRNTADCFSLSLEDEVAVAGRKVLGCAQLKRGPAILQQNSLTFSPGSSNLVKLLGKKDTSVGAETLKNGITQPSVEAVSAALSKALEREFEVRLVPGELSCREKRLIASLEKKYRSFEWNAIRPKRSDLQLTVHTG